MEKVEQEGSKAPEGAGVEESSSAGVVVVAALERLKEADESYDEAFKARDDALIAAKDAGATHRQIADVVGFSPGTIQHWLDRIRMSDG